MTDTRSRGLLLLAALVVGLQAVVLTLSPAVRERNWGADLRWSHWLGIAIWAAVLLVLERLLEGRLRRRDRFVLPLFALLSGLGILTIWRLDPDFGLRQAIWLLVSAAAAIWLVGRWGDLQVLRRYKYILLGSSLFLTALTIFMGTSPTGFGPRLWLGCCGIYLQPSEPLKLLLVIYLAAYLADQVQLRSRAFPLVLPTVLVAGLALLLLMVQRDLGSASILIVLYTIMLYMATERRRVLIATVAALALAAITGFFFVDIVQARLESWLNPWLDPSGRSYQIVQSLLSISNGGIIGRGLGIGSPSLVPVAHSDFIYSAFAEEAGLVGSFALLTALGMLLARGLIVSARAHDRFHRLLAAGITAYLGIQSLLIIGGDLRLLPLTGVTLPFVSYGGSSLLTSSVAVAMLLSISDHRKTPVRPTSPVPLPHAVLAAALGTGLLAAAMLQTWWAVIRGPDLLARTDNARRAIADRYVTRGRILDRNGSPMTVTVGRSGSLVRRYLLPDVSTVIGYTHPSLGQSGLEASLDTYLRGTQGNPVGMLVWEQLLYGTPPPGLDVRLTLDSETQTHADDLLGNSVGAALLMNANSGELLAIASHPAFDANDLDSLGQTLVEDRTRPLINRAAQGLYELEDAAFPLITAARIDSSAAQVARIYGALGLFSPPAIRMPVSSPIPGTRPSDVHVSPLQLAVAAATLSNHGERPAPRVALAVNTPREGWVVLPPLGTPARVFSPEAAEAAAVHYGVRGSAIWEWRVTAAKAGQTLTWYIGGTLPTWKGTPLVAVVLLESGDVAAATEIGTALLGTAAHR